MILNQHLELFVVLQYVTHTVEVESADSQKALAELQMKNAGLQEQLSVQRQLLRELETQLHESQRTCAQLRTQVTSTGASSAAAHLSVCVTPVRLSVCLCHTCLSVCVTPVSSVLRNLVVCCLQSQSQSVSLA